jgi:hypothetical protein
LPFSLSFIFFFRFPLSRFSPFYAIFITMPLRLFRHFFHAIIFTPLFAISYCFRHDVSPPFSRYFIAGHFAMPDFRHFTLFFHFRHFSASPLLAAAIAAAFRRRRFHAMPPRRLFRHAMPLFRTSPLYISCHYFLRYCHFFAAFSILFAILLRHLFHATPAFAEPPCR